MGGERRGRVMIRIREKRRRGRKREGKKIRRRKRERKGIRRELRGRKED